MFFYLYEHIIAKIKPKDTKMGNYYMNDKYMRMKNVKANIDFSEIIGKINFKSRHSLGIGGVNPAPMPEKVIRGTAKLKPKLIRIFIQEFFFIEKDGGKLDFTTLDKYMRSVSATGADIMASICIKPKSLYPVVDETIWKPDDINRWQYIIGEMVKRYSVENKYVTHWAAANEINIGEWGGCPYRIDSAKDYFEYYKMTTEPILKAYPKAKVGGPSYAGLDDKICVWFDEFIGLCKKENIQLDFISYNNYSDIPEHHVNPVIKIKEVVDKYDGKNIIEMYMTELNVDLGGLSIEERAYTPQRSAGLAAILNDFYKRANFANTFQYHIYDQFCDPEDFKPFYAMTRYMAEHWNDSAHRLGLFDEYGKPRPQYFVYDMLYSMAENEVGVYIGDGVPDAPENNIRIIASCNDRYNTIFLTNYNPDSNLTEDLTMSFKFKNAQAGITNMKVYRIDEDMMWDDGAFELIPVEDRTVYLHDDFHFDIYVPADSVVMIAFDYDV